MALNLTEQTAQHLKDLEQLAAQDNKSLDELLEMIVQRYALFVQAADDADEGSGTPGNRLLEASDRMNYHSGHPDTVERSREILENEFADYLNQRMNRNAD